MNARTATILLIALTALKPCLADPIPAPPPPPHLIYAQLMLPVLINYVWNLAVLGIVFVLYGIKVRSKMFFLFVLTITITGLAIDAATIIAFAGDFGFQWILTTGVLLFFLAFGLTKLFYRLPKQKCAISGLAYSAASHPFIGITFILPALMKLLPYSPI